jgi:hypothetical protein
MRVRCGRFIALAVLLAAAACGGGGGGADGDLAGDDDVGSLTVEFAPTEISLSNVEGQETAAQFRATLDYTGNSNLFLFLEERNGVVTDGDGVVNGNVLVVNLAFDASLPAGVHSTEVLLHACLDPDCRREVGNPARLPVRYEVLPNIGLQSALSLRRAGREPAPEATVPVTVPPAAGQVLMLVNNHQPEVLNVSFDGSHLRVQTRQERAGTYRGTVLLFSESDPRYRRSTEITYTVDPPPGGERELSLSENWVEVNLQQGTTMTRRLRVNRPTWTDVLDPLVVRDEGGVLLLRDLGNDEYEVTLDARGKAAALYFPGIEVTAGPTGGRATVSYPTMISQAFFAQNSLSTFLGTSSTAVDLRRATHVLTFDGIPQRWSASSSVPWLRLLNSQGVTGVDELVVEFDAAALPALGYGQAGEVSVSIDRAGTTPMVLQAAVDIRIPYVQYPGMRTLVGDRGRLYVEGRILPVHTPGSILGSGILSVDGARLLDAAIVNDNRFVGDVSVLRVDVADVLPGRDIVIRLNTPLLSSEVTIAAEAPVPLPEGYAALPYANYRPPQYAPGLDALYFAGPDAVYRWAHDASGWRLESAPSPGVIDVALRPDEQVLYTVNGPLAVHALEPVSLARLGQGGLHQVVPDFDASDFDPEARAGQRALAFSADFRAFASKKDVDHLGTRSGVDWLMPAVTGDLLSTPRWGGQATSWRTSAAPLCVPRASCAARVAMPCWRNIPAVPCGCTGPNREVGPTLGRSLAMYRSSPCPTMAP